MNISKVMQKSFYVNIGLVIIKIISGMIFQSVALIADGVHSISDLLSDIFVLLGVKQSLKPADDDHPFGHGKFEYILSLFLGLSIILIAYNLAKEVITNFTVPTPVPRMIVLVVILVVVVLKLVLARYLIKQGKILDSEIVKASGKESFTDVISSAVVFIGVISVIIGDQLGIDILKYGDKVSSIVISLFIIRIGISIIIDAIKHIQGTKVDKEICLVYKKQIESTKGVIKCDQLDIIAYGPYYQAIVEIKVDGNITVKEGHIIAHSVQEKLLSSEKISHVSIHVNPEDNI
jgi:cation diffusion facilitator family transporter